MTKPDRLWDWIARRYERRARKDEVAAWAVGRLLQRLGAGDTVLDYGCGPGNVALPVSAHVKEVHGIDTSTRMIEVAEANADARGIANVRFARKALFDEELETGAYDVIVAFNVLHLLEDARVAVQRASELLRPGGLMVSSTPCVGEAGMLLRTLVRLTTRLGVLSYLRSFTIADMEDVMRAGGLRVEESEVHGGTVPSCLLVARSGESGSEAAGR